MVNYHSYVHVYQRVSLLFETFLHLPYSFRFQSFDQVCAEGIYWLFLDFPKLKHASVKFMVLPNVLCWNIHLKKCLMLLYTHICIINNTNVHTRYSICV